MLLHGFFEPQFHVRFPADCTGSLLYRSAEVEKSLSAAGEPLLLRLGRAGLYPAADRFDPRKLLHCPRSAAAAGKRKHEASEGMAARRHPCEPADAAVFQVFRPLCADACDDPGAEFDQTSGACAAARHLVLHFPRYVLSDRRLPRRLRRGKEPARLCDLRRALPAPDRRPHRPVQGRFRAARGPAEEYGPVRGRRPPFHDRPCEKGAHCQQPRQALGRLFDHFRAHDRRRVDRRVRVLAGDLLRLLRLQRYGHRHRQDVRL